MFGAMKRSHTPGPPCPCGGKCLCHRPPKRVWHLFVLAFLALMLMPIGAILLVYFSPPVKRTIHVGNQICEVKFVETDMHCTSTGGCHHIGYDMAVCPNP